MRIRHPLFFGFFPLLVFVTSLLVCYVVKGIPMHRYNARSGSISQKISALRDRRPAAVRPKLWEESVSWAITAQGNICYSEEHASYESICRFEKQLDEKLKGDVDLATLAWIGERLAETGPHGQRTMTRWREQWKALQESGM